MLGSRRRRRREHGNSRAGCLQCKRRKVKVQCLGFSLGNVKTHERRDSATKADRRAVIVIGETRLVHMLVSTQYLLLPPPLEVLESRRMQHQGFQT